MNGLFFKMISETLTYVTEKGSKSLHIIEELSLLYMQIFKQQIKKKKYTNKNMLKVQIC